MSRARRRGALLGAAIALTFPLSACVTTVRQNPDLVESLGRIDRVAVIPPEVEIVHVVFKGDNEPLTGESDAIAGRLPELIGAELRRSGFAVTDARLGDADLDENPELRFQATQVRREYDRISSEMYESIQMERSKALSYEADVGDEINIFADHAGADAFVFVKMNGFEKSGGEIAKDIALSVLIAAASMGSAIVVQPTQGAVLEAALVDGTSGDVLWANRLATQGDFQGSGLGTMVAALFKEFPTLAQARDRPLPAVAAARSSGTAADSGQGPVEGAGAVELAARAVPAEGDDAPEPAAGAEPVEGAGAVELAARAVPAEGDGSPEPAAGAVHYGLVLVPIQYDAGFGVGFDVGVTIDGGEREIVEPGARIVRRLDRGAHGIGISDPNSGFLHPPDWSRYEIALDVGAIDRPSVVIEGRNRGYKYTLHVKVLSGDETIEDHEIQLN
jgi:hypothetical protein